MREDEGSGRAETRLASSHQAEKLGACTVGAPQLEAGGRRCGRQRGREGCKSILDLCRVIARECIGKERPQRGRAQLGATVACRAHRRWLREGSGRGEA